MAIVNFGDNRRHPNQDVREILLFRGSKNTSGLKSVRRSKIKDADGRYSFFVGVEELEGMQNKIIYKYPYTIVLLMSDMTFLLNGKDISDISFDCPSIQQLTEKEVEYIREIVQEDWRASLTCLP